MKCFKLLAAMMAVLMLLSACDKSNTGTTKNNDSIVEIDAENSETLPQEPQIPQTAKIKPSNNDELYQKWMGLGVVSEDNRFRAVTNAQLCTIINSVLGYDLDGVHHYYDLFRDDPYYYDVMTIDAMGFLTGSGGYFRPEEPVTRERAVIALCRAFGGELPEDEPTTFTDDSQINYWARPYCLMLQRNNWYTGSALRPQEEMKENELLWILDRIVNDIVEGSELSGTYYSGIVITGGQVDITDAEIYGNVYIRAGQGPVTLKITDSTIHGTVFVGRGIARESELQPEVNISSSQVYCLTCDTPADVYLDCQVEDVYINEATNLYLGDNAVVDFMLTGNAVTVTGSGTISMAVITYEATGSSFAVAPKVYLDAPGGYYSGGQTGFVEILGNTYLVGESGELYTGFVMVDNEEYYFDEDGIMATGVVDIDGITYKFSDAGVLISGFKHQDGNTYYYDLDGNMYTGRCTINGKDYIFDDTGILQKGLFTYEDCLFLADSNGALFGESIVEYQGETYAVDTYGKLITGLVDFDGANHWFDPETGAMVRSATVDQYTIDENGVITNIEYKISSGSEELDAIVDDVLSQICTEDMTLEEKMWAAYAWTKVNVRYRSTPIDLSNGYTQELVIEHGLNTFNTRRGACEHFAIVNGLLFNRLGVEVIYIQGDRLSLNYGDWADHTWILAKTEDGLWYHYDALFEYSNLGIERGLFAKTDSDIADHHRWDHDDYPVCDGETVYDD